MITSQGAHTGSKAPINVVGFLKRVLVHSNTNDDKQPRFLVGHLVTKIKTSSVSWKTEVCGEKHNVNLGRKHTVACRLTICFLSKQTTAKFDADDMLKRHEHDDDVDPRESKRVRFIHKQPDKRAGLEMTDDTATKRSKIVCFTFIQYMKSRDGTEFV